jgi:DNA invertase Pin-like site-specific DNA recombinase
MTDQTDWPKRFARAKRRYTEARQHMHDLVLEAIADGQTEAGIARMLGVDRMTVRSWLGKR